MAFTEVRDNGRVRGGYRDLAGKKRYVAGTFSSRRAALRAATEEELTVRNAKPVNVTALTLTWGDWCEQWWPTRAIEPVTAANEGSMVTNHIAPEWADVPLADITRHDVQAWATGLGEKLAPGSMKRVLGVFVSSLSAAIDAELIDSNPANRIKLPPTPQGKEVYLTRAQFDRFSDAIPYASDTAIAQMLVGTGMRWGELAGLHWHNLDVDGGMVTIADVASGGEIKPYPKGRRQRRVPVFEFSFENLVVPEKVVACDVPHRHGKCPSGLVFPSRTNGTLDDRNYYRRVMEPALKKAELDGLGATLHDLRHTYASWLIQAGVPLERIAMLLGHASTNTTQIYAHLAPTQHADLEAVFKGV